MEEECDDHQDFLTVQGTPSIDCQEGREVKFTPRDDPYIDRFLSDIPALCSIKVTCGLIWDKRLQPFDGRYEPNLHYFPTGQQTKKSVHGLIEFYRDGHSGTTFAVKILKEKDCFHAEEIRSRLQLKHINIADVYGVMIRTGVVHILMEYAGTPLVKERNWFAESPKKMCQLALQSFKALAFLHTCGFVHCDIKPDNLMVVRKNNDFTLKIIDFGTCRHIKQPLPKHAHTTWQYWPPEMWKACEKQETFLADPSMDVYAMTLTLYFVQMGSHLMLNMPNELMSTKPELVKVMAVPESIPVDLRYVMNYCLNVDTESRFTAEEAARRLEDTDSPSRKEDYLDNLGRVAQRYGKKKTFVDKWLEQSGAKVNPTSSVVGSSRRPSHRELALGPDAVRFTKKTSTIFQKLNSISSTPSSSNNDNNNSVYNHNDINCTIIPECEPNTSNLHEIKEQLNCCQSSSTSLSVVKTNEGNQQGEVQSSSFPCLTLLEKICSQHKSPKFAGHDVTDQQPVPKHPKVTSLHLSAQEPSQSMSKVGKMRTTAGVAKQKSRAKVRQKKYDRNQVKNSAKKNATEKVFGKVEKLWPSSFTYDSSLTETSVNNTSNTDDMDLVFEAFEDDAFKPENENNITDYMFDMLQRHESEEGSERILADMDGMSLSSPDVTETTHTSAAPCIEDCQTDTTQFTRLVTKDKPLSQSVLPHFELIS